MVGKLVKPVGCGPIICGFESRPSLNILEAIRLDQEPVLKTGRSSQGGLWVRVPPPPHKSAEDVGSNPTVPCGVHSLSGKTEAANWKVNLSGIDTAWNAVGAPKGAWGSIPLLSAIDIIQCKIVEASAPHSGR